MTRQSGDTPVVRGGCACGLLRFEFRGRPRIVSHCHCDTCRRAHGAGVVTFANYGAEQFAWTVPEAATVYVAPNGAHRTFCPNCGSPLLYEGPHFPGEIHLPLGAVEGEYPFPPESHFLTAFAPAWLPITDSLPIVD